MLTIGRCPVCDARGCVRGERVPVPVSPTDPAAGYRFVEVPVPCGPDEPGARPCPRCAPPESPR